MSPPAAPPFGHHLVSSLHRHVRKTGEAWPNTIVRVLLRTTDPREFGANRRGHSGVLKHVNEILQIEGLRIEIVDSHPRIRKITSSEMQKDRTPQELFPSPDFSKLTSDAEIAELLSLRWTQAQLCHAKELCLAAIILMGSLMEGALYARAISDRNSSHKSTAAPPGSTPIEEWKCEALINVALTEGWIKKDANDSAKNLKDWRNYVHLREHAKQGTEVDLDTCDMGWSAVRAVVNDLLKT